MIEQIEGVKETVHYKENPILRLHINHEKEDYPLHWHPAIEVIMPIKGNYTVVVEDFPYRLACGDILIIPSGSLHKIIQSGPGERYIFQIHPRIFMDNHSFGLLTHLLFPCAHLEKSDCAIYETLAAHLFSIAREYSLENFLKETAIQAEILSFFTQLGRFLRNEKRTETAVPAKNAGNYHDAFLLTCEYITEHFTEDFTSEELSARAGLSKFYFLRQFKQYTGSTLGKYITGLRIKQAERLLGSSRLPVTEVALLSGFGSIATFNRIFREYHRCTPTKYREMNENC